jgi:hypothetical protein
MIKSCLILHKDDQEGDPSGDSTSTSHMDGLEKSIYFG